VSGDSMHVEGHELGQRHRRGDRLAEIDSQSRARHQCHAGAGPPLRVPRFDGRSQRRGKLVHRAIVVARPAKASAVRR
jgi:hypothetical protein